MAVNKMRDVRYQYFKRQVEQRCERSWGNIHLDCQEAIFNYLVYGWEPGGFLTAVMANDLYRAATVSDIANVNNLAYVAKFVVYALPQACYGNYDQIKNWLQLTDQAREEILVVAELLPDTFQLIKFMSEEHTDPSF